MLKIGIVSDTHSYVDDKLLKFFESCDEIWHAGDIGDQSVMDTLSQIAKIRAVHGNIDSGTVKQSHPLIQNFEIEGMKIFITHIGGYPSKYNPQFIPLIDSIRPNLMVAGHSHILKVQHDARFDMLYINPGAYGMSGFHNVRTAIRLKIEPQRFFDLEVFETAKKHHIPTKEMM
jgi:putative phosphoesterase